jgi:Ca2+-binding RTX toxin-like protein
MAKASKLVFNELYAEHIGDVNFTGLEVDTRSSSKVVYTNAETGVSLVMQGSGLKVQDDVIVKGTINSLTFLVEEGVAIKFTSMNVDARKISHTSFEEFATGIISTVVAGNNLLYIKIDEGVFSTNLGAGSDKMYGGDSDETVFAGRGNDILFGRGGNDNLSGNEGRDRLIGGAGSDIFTFANGDGRDIVTDFDAIGGEGNQDIIGAAYSEVTVRGDGKDTILDFGGGDRLTLLNVKARDIDESDFLS